MAELTYEALLDYRRRLQQGETDIEAEAERHSLAELAEAHRSALPALFG